MKTNISIQSSLLGGQATILGSTLICTKAGKSWTEAKTMMICIQHHISEFLYSRLLSSTNNKSLTLLVARTPIYQLSR